MLITCRGCETTISPVSNNGRLTMFAEKSKPQRPPIVQLVPGYGFYNGIGTGLAENLVDLIEFLVAVFNPARR